MKYSLICQGQICNDMLDEDIDDGDLWMMAHDFALENLDPSVRKNFRPNKSLRKGFAKLVHVAVKCPGAQRVPTADNIEWSRRNACEWPPHTKHFLERAGLQGGSRGVLRWMFDCAKEGDEKAGNGEAHSILEELWPGLPACRNDHEFEFVAKACGYSQE